MSSKINPWSSSFLETNFWFALPFSGNCNQNYHPTTAWGMKGNPVIECGITTDVASYGSQLGTIIDVLEEMKKDAPVKSDKVVKLLKLAKDIDDKKKSVLLDIAKDSLKKLLRSDRKGFESLVKECADTNSVP